MKTFVAFWKKDLINKLIVITILALFIGASAMTWLLINIPQGKSLSGALSDFLPATATPTFDLNAYLPTATSTPFTLPTFTLIPSTPTTSLETAIPTPEPSATRANEMPTPSALLDSECIPSNPPETGRVVEILDGNTIRVLINGLVYSVRYIGVQAPTVPNFAQAATYENGNLVFAKDITLIADSTNKDARGRLLRYVKVGETFVNYEILRMGWGSALDAPPDSSCTEVLAGAEQAARLAEAGQWHMPKP